MVGFQTKLKHGALMGHITATAEAEPFQPMNVNFGLMPPIAGAGEKGRSQEGLYLLRP